MTKYIFVTGGVISGVGKGIFSASLAKLLQASGNNVNILKVDPYLNQDPGTLNPAQHGEVYVTVDGKETDLDLGHYERFLNRAFLSHSSVTSGQIYQSVFTKERSGYYLGQTVQIVPHVTDEIKRAIGKAASDYDVLLVEIGGTVGDIESQVFVEGVRQFINQVGKENCCNIHVTYLPWVAAIKDTKTKPAQHTLQTMRACGLDPDILICRSEFEGSDDVRAKLALSSGIAQQNIIFLPDMNNVYEIPLFLDSKNVCSIVKEKLSISLESTTYLVNWKKRVDRQINATTPLSIGIVGKYTEAHDAYLSIEEAIKSASINLDKKVEISIIDAEKLTTDTLLANLGGILVPGGFGCRGIDGMIRTAKYARESKIPFLGICLGMQVAVLDYAQNIAKLEDANSTEFEPNCKNPVIKLLADQQHIDYKSECIPLKLGNHRCLFTEGSKLINIYKRISAFERHRNRYELNKKYIQGICDNGYAMDATCDRGYVQAISLIEHPFFIGVQFHPEFSSSFETPHPLFIEFLSCASRQKDKLRLK